MPTPQPKRSPTLTAEQSRAIQALLPDDLEHVAEAVAGGHGYLLYHRLGTGIALVLCAVNGKLAGWIAYPAVSHDSAKRVGLQLAAGLDAEAREVISEAAKTAQSTLERVARR